MNSVLAWAGLAATCVAVSALVHWFVRPFWVSVPLAAVAGPAAFLAMAAVLSGSRDAFGFIVLLVGQVIALPASLLVGAVVNYRRAPHAP